MTNDSEILTASTELTLRGEKIRIRELKWKETLAFFKDVSAFVPKLFGNSGEMKLSPELFSQLVTEVPDLAEQLLTSTIEGKNAEFFGDLTNTEFLTLLSAAIEFQFRAFQDAGKSIAGRLQKTATASPASSQKSEKSTTS